MRADGINPRVGMAVAICTIFLLFGFMFAVSGTKGEALGPVPLIALGPSIFFPALAVIILAFKTNGFQSWPWPWLRLHSCRGRCCCTKRKEKSKLGWGSLEDLEGLYSIGGSNDSSLGGSLGSDKAHITKGEKVLQNLKDYCPSGGLKGAPERPAGFGTLQQDGVGKITPYTFVAAHTTAGVALRDGFMKGPGGLPGLPCFYSHIRWVEESIV